MTEYRPDNTPMMLVEWEDTFGCPAGWEFEDEVSVSTSRILSLGWKTQESDDYLFLCPHRSRPREGRVQVAGHIAIPKRQIIAVREVV